MTELASINVPKNDVLTFLKNKRPSASFVCIHNYTNKDGDEYDVQVITNLDYERIVKASLTKLETINSVTVDNKLYTEGDDDFDTAYEEVKTSLEKSSKGENEVGIAREAYFDHIAKGVKVHLENGAIYITGKQHKKFMIKEGIHKEVKSKLKTKIKNTIRKQLPVSEWKTYKLVNNFNSLAMEGVVFDGSVDLYE